VGIMALKGLTARVTKLGGRLAAPCPTCHWWERSWAVCDERGTCTRPEQCPFCGRVVPIGEGRVVIGVELELI
jgi:hypothetical protein